MKTNKKRKPKISAVLFDLDQTLIDFVKMKRVSCKAAIHAMIASGLRLNQHKAEKILFAIYDRFGMEDPLIFQKFLTKTTSKIDYRMLANAVAAYRRAQPGVMIPYPRVIETLIFLKQHGLKLGVVSDAPRIKAWLRLAEMGLTDFFDIVVTFDDTHHYKPHRAPFEKALQKLNEKPENVLFVGDHPSRDIWGAHRAKMQTCLARYGYQQKYLTDAAFTRKKVKPDYTVQTVAGLKKIVKQSAATKKL